MALYLTGFAPSAVSSVEDPEKMLEQTVNEMQSDLIKMRQSSAQVLASQKQIEAKYNQSRDTAVSCLLTQCTPRHLPLSQQSWHQSHA